MQLQEMVTIDQRFFMLNNFYVQSAQVTMENIARYP